MDFNRKLISAFLLTVIALAAQMAYAADQPAQIPSIPGCEESDTPPWTPPPSMEFILTSEDKPCDLINLYVHGTLEDLRSGLKNAGWIVGPEANFPNNLKFIGALAFTGLEFPVNGVWLGIEKLAKVIFRHPRHLKNIPNPTKPALEHQPISNEDLCGKKARLMYEMRKHTLSRRDHIRIYDLGQNDKDGHPVYGIAASRDIGIKFDLERPLFLFMTHKIEENQDPERDFLVDSLDQVGALDRVTPISIQPPPAPLSASGAYTGDAFADDLYLSPSEEPILPEKP